jgi:hypothetical protein
MELYFIDLLSIQYPAAVGSHTQIFRDPDMVGKVNNIGCAGQYPPAAVQAGIVPGKVKYLPVLYLDAFK